jgi:hypothetical protein
MFALNYIRSRAPFGLLGSSKKPNKPALAAAVNARGGDLNPPVSVTEIPAIEPVAAAAGAGGGAPPPVAVAPEAVEAIKAQATAAVVDGELPSAEAPGPLPEGVIPVIDLTKAYVDSLPEWFRRDSYKVVMGSGDFSFPDGRLDLEVFERYDVHCCNPNYAAGTEVGKQDKMRNIDYIVSRRLNKIICYIDLKNDEQNRNFLKLFQNSISRIHYVTHGPPVFIPLLINRLLLPDGIMTINSLNTLWPRGSSKGIHQYSGIYHPNMIDTQLTCEENYEDRVLTCRKKQHTGGSRRKRTVRRKRSTAHRRHTKRRKY